MIDLSIFTKNTEKVTATMLTV